MTEYVLTDAQCRALAVLANARTEWAGRTSRRPVIRGDATTDDPQSRELLTIHWKTADALVTAGLVRVTNDVLRTLELTDTGRQVAQETGLG